MGELLTEAYKFLLSRPELIAVSVGVLGSAALYKWKLEEPMTRLTDRMDEFWQGKWGGVLLWTVGIGLFAGGALATGVLQALWLATFPPDVPVVAQAFSVVPNEAVNRVLDVFQGAVAYGGLIALGLGMRKLIRG